MMGIDCVWKDKPPHHHHPPIPVHMTGIREEEERVKTQKYTYDFPKL